MNRRLFFSWLLLILAVVVARGQTDPVVVNQCVYWVDDDWEGRGVADVSDDAVSFDIDCATLSSGLHFLSVQPFADGIGCLPQRYIFYVPEKAQSIGYEYWIDGQYSSSKKVGAAEASNPLVIDISQLESGLHYLTVQACSDISKGSFQRFMFFVPENAQNIGYEYWIDDQYGSLKKVAASEASNPLIIDISQLESGLHYLSVQACTDTKKGSFKRIMFYVPEKLATIECPIINVAYYVDDRKDETIVQKVENAEFVILQDISMLDADNHTIHISMQNADGLWTVFEEYEFVTQEYVVEKPQIAFAGNVMTITTATEGASIYYTLNGTAPTTESNLYSEPVTVTQNCTVKAIAVADGYTDSEVASYTVDWFKVADVVFTQKGTTVEMNTTTEGAVIHYTTNGSSPTAASAVYSSPLSFDHNVTIKAIGVKANFKNSGVTTYEYKVDAVTVATPAFERKDNTLTITTATEGAAIYYTMDGTTPTVESIPYKDAITLTQNCTVKAIAAKEGFFPSAVATYTVDWFQVSVSIFQSGTEVMMEATPADAEIRYTTDGSEPTSGSTLYAGPFSPTTDVYILAVGLREGFKASDIVSLDYRLGVVTVAAPTFIPNEANGTIGIECATEGATIYYTLDGSEPTSFSNVYNEPIVLTRNCTVRALAVCEGYYDSFVSDYVVNWFSVEIPVMALDYATGRVAITCSTAGSTIHYSIGSGTPQDYSGPVTLTDNSSVRAWATAEGFIDSGEASLKPIANGTMDGETFRINGAVTANELLFLRNIMGQQMEHLDMENATLTDSGLGDEAFAGMGILTVRLPKSMTTVGERLFNGCRRLAAVVWRAGTGPAPTAAVFEGIGNPNLLLYVDSEEAGRSTGVANLIVNQMAAEITLCDPVVPEVPAVPENPVVPEVSAVSDYNFYCPIPFTASRISYSHVYTQQSGIGGTCQGWETIALPFDVQTITHRIKGAIAPFGSPLLGGGEGGGAPRFWLYELGSTRFEVATTIEANKPYVISMPQNPGFAAQYCLGGDTVTFSSTNAYIPETAPQTATRYTKSLHANFTTQAASASIWAMNIGEPQESYAEGSVFVQGLRAVRPFEAYGTTTSGVRYITLFDDNADGIKEVENGQWPMFNVQSSMFNVYDLNGRRTTDGGRRILPHKRLVIKNGKVKTAK